MDEVEVRTALAQLGPFFAVEAIGAGGPAPGDGTTGPDGWRSMAELADGGDALTARVARVRELLAQGGGQPEQAVEVRVAASVVHLGLVARLVAPFLALAVLHGRVPERLRLADLRWRPALGGPYPLALPPAGDDALCAAEDGDPHGADPAALADRFATAVFAGAVREIGDACGRFRVSPHVLRGNAASALNGAASMIAAARPDAAARARTLAGLLLERDPLRGGGLHTAAGAFRRSSCCLIYRAAPGRAGALCGDCVLSRAPVRPA
ncbi:(2Fe-2S)-binding protein [Actinacidiphila yanglinensis]|uniref:(2Fe-2S)-binding protein n=1 Tax=Actinacidiphila yanglinensis TaxID=310779 RepID=UPI000CDEB4EC|nr:(2Fe-2S)-binding protein [Actinacidiphila yanglinensis]